VNGPGIRIRKVEKSMSFVTWCSAGLVLATTIGLGVPPARASHVIKVGGTCDRTGETKVIGLEACPRMADYIGLVNKKGGVLGHRLEYTEIDIAYKVDRAVDAYEQLKRNGAVTIFNYGVPMLFALTPRYMADRIPAFQAGTGRSDAIDGESWPYIFPGTASYWSQAGVAMKYVKDNGARKGTKIAYLYLDNPAGRQGLTVVEAVAKIEGYELRPFAIQPPGLDMASQVADISQQFRADWVIGSLFGRSPSVSIKEFKRADFPLNRVVSFAWGAGDPDIEAAGWDVAQGYLGLQYAAVGRSHAIIREIIEMFRDQRKDVPRYVGGVYYNRGVSLGAIIVEGIRLAIQNHGLPVTGDKVRRGYEDIRNFDLQGFLQPLTITPQDHEGGGIMRVYQVKGKEWVPVSGWIRGYHDEVMTLVKKANNK
jgi:branched-chain amino acid transport system substrate-binding protein